MFTRQQESSVYAKGLYPTVPISMDHTINNTKLTSEDPVSSLGVLVL